MTIAWDTAGGLFTRIGKLIGGLNEVQALRGNTTNLRVSAIFNQYLNYDQIAIDGLYSAANTYQSSSAHQQWLSTLQTEAKNTVIQQANRDVPLSSLDINTALTLVQSEMVSDSQTLDRPTVTASVTEGSTNYGDAALVASVLDTDGGQTDCALAEAVTATVTADSQSGGATAYQESVSLVGLPSVDGLAYNWPQGSACRTSLTITNAATTTLVTNGAFSTWSSGSSPPSGWTVATGTLASTIVRGTSPLRGTYDLQYAGNGSELTSVYQNLTVGSGRFLPNTVYCVGFWAKKSAGLAGGVLQVRLADGSGTTVTNDAGDDCAASLTLTSLTTSYTFHSVFVATPRVLPSTLRLYLNLTTAVTNGETLDIDLVAAVAATRLYAGGPFVAAFSGGTASAKADYWSIDVANDAGTTSLVTGLDRLFSTRNLSIKFPTSDSPTISNALIS